MKLNTSQWALIQYPMYQDQLKETQRHAFNALEKVLADGSCDFIVLPEMWLGGPTQKSLNKSWVEIYKENQTQLCQMAKEHKTAILTCQLTFQNNAYYNTALFINHQGKLINIYNKIHLFTHGGENKIFGISPPIASSLTYRGLKIAQIICYDIRFPELTRQLAMEGIHVLVVHAQWPESRRNHWLTLLKARAIENQIFVVGVNRLGIKRSENFVGDSVVIDPWGNEILHMDQTQSVGLAKIDLTLQSEIRKKYPFFKERRLKKILWK